MKAIILFLLVSIPSIGTSKPSINIDVQGRAFDLDSGELVYQEFHCIDLDNKQRIVEYYDDTNKKILSKWLDYKGGLSTPSMIQIDAVLEETVAMSLVGNSVNMFSDDISESLSIKVDTRVPLVIDAGFDNFIRDYWAELIEGRTIVFQFPVVARKSIFNFEVKASNCRYDNQQDQCFSMEPASWLLSALLDPIELGYDKNSRQLNRYRGLSNVEDRNGSGYEVDIHYEYQTVSARQCDAVDVDALWAKTLPSPLEIIEDNKK
ncbi:MAG: hypothetical protein ACI845_000277 [Gammaproteobacteria bacterium]|jgi:hypothetical protein